MKHCKKCERDMHERHVDLMAHCRLCRVEARETGRMDALRRNR